MAGSFAVNGLISGLDTQSIIDQLIAIQTTRITRVTEKQAEETNIITLFQQLQGIYLGVRTAANNLKDRTLYEKKGATSSDTDILTVSATPEAVVGSHQFTVKQLAKNNQFVSNRFTDTDATTLGTGNITITQGVGANAINTVLTVDSTNNTLEGIANLIEKSSADVTTNIVKVDDSATPYQLIVTARNAGEANQISISFESSLKASVTGEILGEGAATATQDTDDSDDKTYALRHLPNAGTFTVKVDGSEVKEQFSGTSATASSTGGTLPDSTEHFYVVVAKTNSTETHRSGIFSVTTPAGAGTNSVSLQFNDIQGATDYDIYRIDDTENGGSTEIADFEGQFSLIGTVSDDGSSSFTFTDTSQAQTAALSSLSEGVYTLSATTGAVAFTSDQSGTVTADYEYDLEFVESQAAQDAQIDFGSGSSAVTVRKSSNTITDLINGVTLNLIKEDATQTITVNITRNTLGVSGVVDGFVDALNAVEKFVQDKAFFDTTTNATGPLFGDPNLLSIRTKVASIVTGPVSSIGRDNIRSIAQAGITVSPETGNFVLSLSELNSKLKSDPDQVRDLFASVATATDINIEAIVFTDKTVTSSPSGYEVVITQAAKQGKREGVQDVSGGLLQDETLTITSGSAVANLTLTSGSTAQSAVASINTALENASIKNVVAEFDSTTGKISLRHKEFGSDFSFTVTSSVSSGTAGSTRLGSGNAGLVIAATGQDVAGTINGEAATGVGQILTGNSGNAKTDGLKLQVKLTPDILTLQGTAQGEVVVSSGIAAQLEEFLTFLTDESKDGAIQSAIAQADARAEDFQDTIDTLVERAARDRERLQRQFVQLEQALGALQTTSTFLDGQLRQIQANSEALIRRRAR